jgi:hypothetical protein
MMTMRRSPYVTGAALGFAACIAWLPALAQSLVPIKNSDIGGVVSGPKRD